MKLSKNDTAFFLCLLSWADAPIYINLSATSAITERQTAGTHHPEAEWEQHSHTTTENWLPG